MTGSFVSVTSDTLRGPDRAVGASEEEGLVWLGGRGLLGCLLGRLGRELLEAELRLELLERSEANDALRRVWLAVLIVARAEERDCGNAHDVERLREHWVGVDIDLDDLDRPVVFIGEL